MRSQRRWRVGGALAVSLLFLGGCGDSRPADGGADAVSRRDSAGVTIVENGRAAWERSPVWEVVDTPRTVIGAPAGERGRPLVRVMSAAALPDGRILVANGGANQVLVFDSSGQYRGNFGGEGEGPRELRSLVGMWAFADDSILVADASGVAHVFTTDGTLARLLRADLVFGSGTEPLGPRIRGIFDDGRILASPWAVTFPEYEGPYRDTLHLSILDREGHLVRRLGRLLGRAWYQVNDEMSRVRFAIPMPFPRETFGIAAGSHLYVVDNGRYETQVRSTTGEVEMLVRRDQEMRSVGPEDMQQYRDAQFERVAATSDRVRRRIDAALTAVLAGVTGPEVFPAIRDVHVATDGNIWVREYQPASARTDWTVFGPDGAIVARTRLPDALTTAARSSVDHPVLEIGADYVMGLVAGEDDVELIHVYTIEKEPVGR